MPPPGSVPFVERYAAAFGRRQSLVLRLSGLLEAEVYGDGAIVRDATGRDWLDFGSFGVHLLGHRHPEVIKAATSQLSQMGLSTKILGNYASTACAEALTQITPPSLDRVVFANSGSEAVDIAIKLTFLATGRRELVALRNSYHGKTLGALSISDTLGAQRDIGAQHPVHFVEAGDTESLRNLLESQRIAGVFIEPVQGEGGILPMPREFLNTAAELCRSTGTVFVLDEIQTGLGRCGPVWRSAAYEPPDILLTGKTLGGGLVPIAAAVFSSAIVSEVWSDPVLLASSFSGGAFASRVATTVIDLVKEAEFQERVMELGDDSRRFLRESLADTTEVVDIRGEGLMIGVEVTAPAITGRVILEAASRGVLLTFCLHNPSVLRVYPPATSTDDQLSRALEAISESIHAATTTVQLDEARVDVT